MIYIRAECGMASIVELTPDNVKKQLKYCEIPAEVEWRKGILSEILLARDGHLVVENFSGRSLYWMIRLPFSGFYHPLHIQGGCFCTRNQQIQ
jgi:hypothetical protein